MSKPFNIDILRQTAENLLKNKRRLQGKYGVALQEEKMDKIELVSPNDQMMERVMKVINENISSPDLSVEFIADKIGISRVPPQAERCHRIDSTRLRSEYPSFAGG